MNRPTMPGVNTAALDRFTKGGAGGYAALYDDDTRGPRRRTREDAERDYSTANAATGERRTSIERYGVHSKIFTAWGKIHADFKSDSLGERHVLAMDTFTGATVLAAWIGPEV